MLLMSKPDAHKEDLFFGALQKLNITTNKKIIVPKTHEVRRGIVFDELKFVILVEVNIFDNLASFLWARYNEGEDIMNAYKKLKTYKGRVIDISWGIENKKTPLLLNKTKRKSLLFIVLREMRALMSNTLHSNNVIGVKPNELVVAFPMGAKQEIKFDGKNAMLERDEIEKGVRNREYFAKRFGFSNRRNDDWCYSRISQEMDLVPY